MFDGRWRHSVDGATAPVGKFLKHTGVSADVLTAFGLAASLATALAIATGHLLLGLVLMVLAAVADLLDGPVAKASGRASARGAFFDSVADRVSDALVLGGIAWFLVASGHGLDAMLAFALYAATALVSYERAKGELLGIDAKGGLMERAERLIALGATLLAASIWEPALAIGLAAMLAAVLATAVGRFRRVWLAADSGDATRRAREPQLVRWHEGRVDSRWRVWRQARFSAHPSARPSGAGLSSVAVPSGSPGGPVVHRRTGTAFHRWRARRAEVASGSAAGRWRPRASTGYSRQRDRPPRRPTGGAS